MTNRDFRIAIEEIPWFFKGGDLEFYSDPVYLDLDPEFKHEFSLTSRLITKARVFKFKLYNVEYRLLGWDTKTGHSCGWICRVEDIRNPLFLNSHSLFNSTIGGIIEFWDQRDEIEATDSFILNQNYLLVGELCKLGLGIHQNYYLEQCKSAKATPLAGLDRMVCFAQELNGNMTLYEPESGEVLLYARDHNFNYVSQVKGQPPFSFYHLLEVKTLRDYIEKIASDWLFIVQ